MVSQKSLKLQQSPLGAIAAWTAQSCGERAQRRLLGCRAGPPVAARRPGRVSAVVRDGHRSDTRRPHAVVAVAGARSRVVADGVQSALRAPPGACCRRPLHRPRWWRCLGARADPAGSGRRGWAVGTRLQCTVERQARPGCHRVGRVHGVVGRAVVVHAAVHHAVALAHRVGEARASGGLEHRPALCIGLEPQPVALAEVGHDGDGHPLDAQPPAAKHAPCAQAAEAGKQFTAEVGEGRRHGHGTSVVGLQAAAARGPGHVPAAAAPLSCKRMQSG